MAVQIQLRNDTAASWTSANPVLAAGEAGIETDTGKLKLGNGSTAWNSLGYFQPTNLDGISDVTITSPSTGQVVQYNGSAWVNSDITTSEVTGLDTALSGLVSKTNGTVTTASTSSTVVRNITLSTSDPTGGMDGDVWLKYTP
jgi:hypothetical protein